MSEKRNRHRNAKKHTSDGGKEEVHQEVDESSPVIKMFRCFQHDLDQRHDKHERIVKISRDITIESKRAIFMLHRVNSATNSTDILQQTEEKLSVLENTKFREVATELINTDPFQFLRAYSPGLQEYIEALTFYFYLKENKLIPLSEVQARLTFKQPIEHEAEETTQDVGEDKQGTTEDTETNEGCSRSLDSGECMVVCVPPSEYILGVADLTGEMMRRAINSVGAGDLDRPFEICNFLQEIEAAYASLGNANREVNRKLYTMRQSLRKVETACYTLKVRGSEIPKHMLVDLISKPSMSQFMDDSIVVEED